MKLYQGGKKYNKILVVPDCLALDQTEVLTKDGWVHLRNLETGTPILIADKERSLFFETPSYIHIQKDREVFTWRRKNVVLETTAGHRHLINNSAGKATIRTTEELFDRDASNLYVSGNYTEGKASLEPELAYLLGFCIGDGTRDTDNWKISVKKSRKINALMEMPDNILTKNGPHSDGYCQFRLRALYTKVVDRYLTKEKAVNISALLALNAATLALVLQGIIDSDGHVRADRPHTVIGSTRRQHIDVIQLLALLVDRKCVVRSPSSNSMSTYPSENPLFNVMISDKIGTSLYGKQTRESRITDVGCVTVSTGIFVVRHAGQVFLTGNCHFPFSDWDAIYQMSKWAKTHKPDLVVQLGDFLDQKAWSRFPKDPDDYSPQEEWDRAYTDAEKFYGLFPNCLFILGNHDSRVIYRATEVGLPRQLYREIEEVFGEAGGFDGWQWRTNPKERLIVNTDAGPVLFMHGDEAAGGAIQISRRLGMNVVMGHTHQHICATTSTLRGSIFGMECGALIDPDSKGARYANRNPVGGSTGFAVIANGVPYFIKKGLKVK